MKRITKILSIIFISIFVLSLSSCKKEKIEVPISVTIDEDNYLTWDMVDDAKEYTITMINVDTNVKLTDTTRKNNYDLSVLQVGDYHISVKAISGNKDKNDSDDSEVLEYHKYQETGCIYKLIKNNTEYAITKVGNAQGTFVIEDYYRGKAVTEIADKAFKGSSKVEDITLGENIIKIGESAFWNCSKLTRIHIPDSVISIGRSAFQSCKLLVDVNLPKYLTEIPEYCFGYCRSIEEITIPEYVTTISSSAFLNCSSIKTIVIPDSVKIINTSAFFGCESLESVTLGSGLITLKESAFSTCKALKSVTFSENSSLKEICASAFRECSSIVDIVIPDGVTSIGEACFLRNSKLETIHIPETVTTIGDSAFTGTKFYNDQVEAKNDLIYADNWLIYVTDETRLNIEKIDNTTIKDTVVGIADTVFAGSTKLKTISLPKSIRYIGNNTFNGCSSLWKLVTPENSLKIIGDYCFCSCALTNISFGNGLERIGHFAFWGNSQLDNNALAPYDLIPESVKSIGRGAFNATLMYQKAQAGSGIVYAGNWAVGLTMPLTTINLKFDTNHVAGIADYTFMYTGYPELAPMYSIRTVTGLIYCKYIGVGAFYGNTELSSVSLSENIEEIPEAAFYNTGLVEIDIPKTLKSIGDYAFSGSKLTNINLKSTKVKTIGKSAFAFNTGLVNVSLPTTLEYIDEYAFYSCANIKNISIPDSVTYIGNNCFCGCNALETASLSSGIDTIETALFAHCSSLTSISGLENIKTINAEAFYECTSLETIDLSSKVETIGDAAFLNDTNLKSIYFSDSLKIISTYCFEGCKSLSSIVLPNSVITIQQHAFYECDNLTIYTAFTEKPGDWHARSNSSNRPVFYGVILDEHFNVTSVKISTTTLTFKNALNGLKCPNYKEKNFLFFVDDNGNNYNMEDLINIEEDIILNAIFE